MKPAGSTTAFETYFDITDLVSYLSAHGTVTGVQRVEAQLLAGLAMTTQAVRSWCVATDHADGSYRAWRLDQVFADAEADEVRSLFRLASPASGSRWPTRPAVRRYLNQQGARGWQRMSLKAGLYARAIVAPSSLEQCGLITRGESPPALAPIHLEYLPPGATLVVAGAGWNQPAAAAAAALHARRGGRVVHWVHDLIPIVCPEYFKAKPQRTFAAYMRRAADYVTEFCCVSRYTQADLSRFLAAQGRRIPSRVLPLAHEFAGYTRNARGCRPVDERLLEFGQPGREFLLCVGTLEVRKNGIALLDAWLRLRSELGDATPHLVFCGRQGWKMEPFFERFKAHPILRERVHLVPTANDRDLAFLYEHSLASVYPSLYEGWGLPVGEAAWFGRLCITSRETALPEVCGRLAEYVDPRNTAEIVAAVRRVATDHDWRQWRERMITAASLRTWRDVAADFHDVVDESRLIRRAA